MRSASEIAGAQPLVGRCMFCWSDCQWQIQLRIDGGEDYVLAHSTRGPSNCTGFGNEGKPCRPHPKIDRDLQGRPKQIKFGRRPVRR